MFKFLLFSLVAFFTTITSSLLANLPIAGIIKVQPKESSEKYENLRCSDDDKAKIREIVTTLAKHSYYDLFANYRSRLEKIGEDVRPVNPLKFLEQIFANSETKECMKAIFNDPIIKYNFMSNFAPRMDVELQKGSLIKMYEDFAKSINASPATLKSYIDNKNWDGFVRYLMNN